MSQDDFIIANQGFPAFRSDLNSNLQALASTSSGATAPSTTYANQLWYDTANDILKIRNEANSAWINVITLDQTNNKNSSITVPTIDSGTSTALTLKSGTTTAMTIDTSQNVGIGTSSPTFTTAGGLHINKSSDATVDLHLTNATTGSSATDGFDLLLSGSDALLVQRENANMIFYTNATERARIDSSGNVGIGTSSPAFDSGSGLEVQRADVATIRMEDTAHSTALELKAANGAVSVSGRGNYPLLFETNGSERARIDSSGNLQVNNTGITSGKVNVAAPSGVAAYCARISTNGDYGMVFQNTGGTAVGSIAINASTTAYNTSSDYRLKTEIQPMQNGLQTIGLLKPSIYKWKADNSYGEGFIAHELQSVIPEAVSGEKDAVDAEGNIKPQGVDYSKIVVHLVAAIQELKAELDALKGTK